jgi:uncharacterized membrane protein
MIQYEIFRNDEHRDRDSTSHYKTAGGCLGHYVMMMVSWYVSLRHYVVISRYGFDQSRHLMVMLTFR